MTIKFGSIFPVKEEDSANTMRTVAEPISDSERRGMMQTWADYLDGLTASDNVVPLKKAK